jgi:ubiquinone/menaquinone biosynthesis C-methylase UbiE
MRPSASSQKEKTDPHSFNYIAKYIFAPIYPVLARQILLKTGITRGTCLDLGSGSAFLAMALSKKAELLTYALDSSPDMLSLAQENIDEQGLNAQVYPVLGDVHSLPWPKESIDLVVSRGSIFFWEDLPKVYQEVSRVLRRGGYAYIGGGFGSQELFEEIREKMKPYEDWEQNVRKRMSKDNTDNIKESLNKAHIEQAEIKDDETGFWIIIRKDTGA